MLKCVNKYEYRNAIRNHKPISYTNLQACFGTQDKANRLYVYDPQSRKWTIAFASYDGKGIVYFSSMLDKFLFSGVIVEKNRMINRRLKAMADPGVLIFEKKLQQGIQTEKKICADLDPYKGGYHIHLLERSGLGSGGTDIVISNEEEQSSDSFLTVSEGIVAIEVLGACTRSKDKNNVSLIYRADKNFKEWQNELKDCGVIPVIAWQFNNKCFYVIMTESILFDCFYIHTKKRGFHQQTNNLLARRLEPYALNAKELFTSINRTIRQKRITWGT